MLGAFQQHSTFPCVLLMDLARYKYMSSVPRREVLRILLTTIDINLDCVFVKATLVLIQEYKYWSGVS